MLLTVKKRQEYLKTLGFYDGKIDGKVGNMTKKAYKDLQAKYFIRTKDRDGLYGKNTDILLRNAYNVYKYCKNHKVEDFACHCKGKYCTGHPAELNTNVLKNIQIIENKYGKMTIQSPLRCKTHNAMQTGSSSSSKHMSGKALDFSNAKTKTLEQRKEIINYWMTLNKPSYSYCNGYYRNGSKSGTVKSVNMGTSIHGDVK